MAVRLVLLLLTAMLLGCQGTSTEAHPGPISDAGIDAADSWSPLCPATLPRLGAACTSPPDLANGAFPGLYCEYGDAWWSIACDAVVVCDESSSAWTTATALQTFAACSPQPGPNQAGCPANPGYGDRGMPCPDAGLTCYYGLGASCLCHDNLDAGPIWSCQPDEPGCPTDRPRVGSGCTGGAQCFYGNDGFGTACRGGVWQLTYYGGAAATAP